MRPILFRFAVLFSMVMVVAPDILPVFEPVEAEGAPRRRRGRRVSRYQSNRANQARYRQQRRGRSQRLAQYNRARVASINRARQAAYTRLARAQTSDANALAARLNNPANVPNVVNKDYQLQMSEKLSVGALTPSGRKNSFEDIAVGQTITVTLVREKDDPADPTKKTTTTIGQLTGRVVKVEGNTVKELTLRVSSYQYGGKNGETTVIPVVPDQAVTSVLIRSQPQGVAGLFNQ